MVRSVWYSCPSRARGPQLNETEQFFAAVLYKREGHILGSAMLGIVEVLPEQYTSYEDALSAAEAALPDYPEADVARAVPA